MRRAPRCPVRYDHSHWVRTSQRFCIWGREIIWMNAHIQKVINPPRRIRPDSKIAKSLPTTAMLPLSEYEKGRGCGRPLRVAEIKRPTYRPCWMATCAMPGKGRPPCVAAAASPTTNIPGLSGTSGKGQTKNRPEWQLWKQRVLKIEGGATPAVHSTV